MVRAIIDFWIRPTFQNYEYVNILFYCTVLCFGAIAGSFVSVIVVASVVYCSVQLATGNLRWALPGSVNIVFFAFCAGIVGDLMMVVLFPYAMAFANVEVNAVNRHQRARSDLQHAGDRAGGRQRRRAAAVRVRGLTC